jgi:alpha-glucosidase
MRIGAGAVMRFMIAALTENPANPMTALLHPPIPPWCVAGPQGLDLVLLTGPTTPAAAFVRSLPDNEELLTPMQPDGTQGRLVRWRARIAWDGGNALTRYCFGVAGADRVIWLGADGEHALVPPEAMHFRVHPREAPPAWVREQVFYQVFPDRFAGAALAGDPDAPGRAGPPPTAFHGGDLHGLAAALPYLDDELGASALYLNPVFTAGSYHRYDTLDYTEVCPRLGGNAALAALRAATRERGMRLVLDAVVNHTGAGHPWVTQQPGRYARDAAGRPLGWKGHASLPVLDFADPGVRDAVYGAHDAVLRRWLRAPYSIDGWRLDVIHMLGEGAGARRNLHHVRAMRRAVRDENPEAYLLGEHFAEATRWLQGDAEDGAMNYHGLRLPVLAWLAGPELGGRRQHITTAAFAAALHRAIAPIPYANQLAQFNLLGSHDTPRLIGLLDDEALVTLALVLLFAWPGVPGLYYGDEVGLAGGPDPDCRRRFPWDRAHWRHGLFDTCRTLARWRRTRSELAHGAVAALGQGAEWFAFARFVAGAASVVVLNRGAAAEVDLPLAALPLAPLGWRTVLGSGMQPDGGRLVGRVAARGAVVMSSR